MIADQKFITASFLAAQMERRLHFAAPIGHKARRVLAYQAFRLRGQNRQ